MMSLLKREGPAPSRGFQGRGSSAVTWATLPSFAITVRGTATGPLGVETIPSDPPQTGAHSLDLWGPPALPLGGGELVSSFPESRGSLSNVDLLPSQTCIPRNQEFDSETFC